MFIIEPRYVDNSLPSFENREQSTASLKEKTFYFRGTKLADERVGKGEHHGDTDTDKEGSVDKTGEKEHLRLERFHQLGLASGGFKVLTDDGDTKASADSTETDDKTGKRERRERCWSFENS